MKTDMVLGIEEKHLQRKIGIKQSNKMYDYKF